MKLYFLIVGVLCLIYYVILVCYSRKLRSTFAVFWLLFGGAHLIAGCAPLTAYTYTILTWICAICWIIFLFVESRIIAALFSPGEKEADVLIVLGAQVRGTRITDSLKRRLDRTLVYLKRYPDVKVIVSGGQGPGEDVAEADAMAEYLLKNGVSPKALFREDQSVSTRENLRCSRKYLDGGRDRIGIVTNGFHIYRALMIAKQEGLCNLIPVPASSNPVFQVNYLVREFFAVLYVWMKKGAER